MSRKGKQTWENDCEREQRMEAHPGGPTRRVKAGKAGAQTQAGGRPVPGKGAGQAWLDKWQQLEVFPENSAK